MHMNQMETKCHHTVSETSLCTQTHKHISKSKGKKANTKKKKKKKRWLFFSIVRLRCESKLKSIKPDFNYKKAPSAAYIRKRNIRFGFSQHSHFFSANEYLRIKKNFCHLLTIKVSELTNMLWITLRKEKTKEKKVFAFLFNFLLQMKNRLI